MYIVYLKLLFFIFPQLCSLQRKNGLSLGNTCMYMNNHACKEISKHNYLSYLQDRSRGFLSIMADGATDVSCLELEIVYAGVQNDNTTVAKRKPEKKNCKSCIYNCDDLLSHDSNSPHSSHITICSQFACSSICKSAAPVSQRSRVRILYKPEFFSVFLFAIAKVASITAMIYFHVIHHPKVQIIWFS